MIPLNTSRPPASQRRLPVFRVTMLGASGVGKTVFMSSMYAILRLGVEQLSIKATDGDVDLELDVNMKNIYANHKFPEGNEAKQKQYKFELRNGDNPVAGIDWVDYRGGDLRAGPNTPEGQAIVERLKSSHAVLWMVDLSSVEGQKMDSFAARLKTEIGRMATLSREAAVSNEPRAWIFVRTKSDRVKNKNSEKDWRRAADELRIHLGDTIKTIIQNPLSRAALVPISSVGTVDEVGDRKVVAGEDPSFVQWPLMLALAFLLDAEAQKLALRHNKLVNDIRSSQSDGGFLPILRRFLDLGPSDEQRAMIHELSAIGQAFVGISENVQALMRTVPPEVVVLQSPNDTHS